MRHVVAAAIVVVGAGGDVGEGGCGGVLLVVRGHALYTARLSSIVIVHHFLGGIRFLFLEENQGQSTQKLCFTCPVFQEKKLWIEIIELQRLFIE